MIVEGILESGWRERNDFRMVGDILENKSILQSRYSSLITVNSSLCNLRGSIQGRAAPVNMNISDSYLISPTVSIGIV